MARPVSRFSQTLQDYGTPGSGSGAEKSNWGAWISTLTAGNFVAVTGAVSTLLTATLGITVGAQAAEKIEATSAQSAVVVTDPLSQRENKWLVRYHDSASTKFSLEIPCADLSLLSLGTEFLDLTVTAVADFVTAFQNVVKSPDDPSLSVLVDSIQFVGRRN